MVLNIAGPEFDFGSVVFVVLQECEHRRRGIEADDLPAALDRIAQDKLAQIKSAFDEFGGSPAYWKSVESEVLGATVPQYTIEATRMNQLELNGFDVWRSGDVTARIVFALVGLLIGSVIVAIPFIPIFEAMFAFALAAGGFLYPDVQRYVQERRHARFLNGLVVESQQYQENAKLHYMTRQEIHDSFALTEPKLLPEEFESAPADVTIESPTDRTETPTETATNTPTDTPKIEQ